jgi:hypothetical protein
VRAYEPALGGDDGSFGKQARSLKTPIRERVPENAKEAQNLLAAMHRPVRCDELAVVAPRLGLRVSRVECLDMPFDDVLWISHQAVPLSVAVGAGYSHPGRRLTIAICKTRVVFGRRGTASVYFTHWINGKPHTWLYQVSPSLHARFVRDFGPGFMPEYMS